MPSEKCFQPIPKATLKELLFWLGGTYKRFIVTGNSMYPTLKEGDVVFYTKKLIDIAIGDVVICHHPNTDKKIIKRIQKKEGNALFLVGDNTAYSTDSRSFGWIDPDACIGVVQFRI